MTIIDKLHTIEEHKNIYDIHYCRAGVGFIFFAPPAGYRQKPYPDQTWKKHLTVEKYYPTFEDAVEAEYRKLTDRKK